MWRQRSLLLSPDGAAGGGGSSDTGLSTPPPSPPQGQQGAGSSGSPATGSAPGGQPQGRYVSDEDWAKAQRAMKQVETSNDLYSKVRQRGLTSDDVFSRLDRLDQLESDPLMQRVLNTPRDMPQQPPAQAGEAQASGGAYDVERIVDQRMKAMETKYFQQMHNQARNREQQLLDSLVTKDERFRRFFQKGDQPLSFSAALEGEGDEMSQFVASAIDQALFVNAPRYADGTPMPVTDSTMIGEIAGRVAKGLEGLRAQTIMAASDSGQSGQHLGGMGGQSNVVAPPAQEETYLSERDALRRNANRTFGEEFRRLSQQGQPASQARP